MLLPPGETLSEEKEGESPAGKESSWEQAVGSQEGRMWRSWQAPMERGCGRLRGRGVS